MPKKFIKLFQTTVPKFYKQNIFLFDYENKDLKCRKPQFKKSKRVSHAIYKNLLKKKQKPNEVLLSVFRFLSASITTKFSQYPKITFLWRAFLPRILREEGVPKTNFSALNRTENDAIATKQSGESNNRIQWTEDNEKPMQREPKKRKKISKPTIEEETRKPKFSEMCNEIEEQKFYTEKNSRKNFNFDSHLYLNSDSNPNVNFNLNFNSNLREQEGMEVEEKTINELPPPQRCRLSCPLPPPEFSPMEINEFHANYQPPSLRFLTLPVEFLPEPRQTMASHKSFTKKKALQSSAPGIKQGPILSNPPNTATSLKNSTPVMPQPYNNLAFSPLKNVPKMRALLFEPTTLSLNYDAVDAPIKIFKDEILVQVAYSGVCGTDLFITEGKLSCGDSPVILGHEISGTVYAVGSEVDHVQPGNKIAVNAYTACSICRYCSRGLFSACLNEGLNNSIGISKNGGWAEYVVVKKSQVYKIPDQLELDQAALIQPLSCILSAMSKLKLFHEMDILVQGLGLSGCLWTSVLHSQGFKNVLVSDKGVKRRLQFESLNTNYLFVPPEDIEKHKVDLIVECTGSSISIEKSFNILNPNGQMCFFRKPHPVTEVRCVPYEIIQKEITIVGNAGNAFHFSKAIDMATVMGRHYLDFKKLGVKTYDLENFKEAFNQKKQENVSKIIFKLDR